MVGRAGCLHARASAGLCIYIHIYIHIYIYIYICIYLCARVRHVNAHSIVVFHTHLLDPLVVCMRMHIMIYFMVAILAHGDHPINFSPPALSRKRFWVDWGTPGVVGRLYSCILQGSHLECVTPRVCYPLPSCPLRGRRAHTLSVFTRSARTETSATNAFE
jgi:hypothetical protein